MEMAPSQHLLVSWTMHLIVIFELFSTMVSGWCPEDPCCCCCCSVVAVVVVMLCCVDSEGNISSTILIVPPHCAAQLSTNTDENNKSTDARSGNVSKTSNTVSVNCAIDVAIYIVNYTDL